VHQIFFNKCAQKIVKENFPECFFCRFCIDRFAEHSSPDTSSLEDYSLEDSSLEKISPEWKILRRSILCPDNSSPDNSSLGYFFARKILRRMISCRKVLSSDDSLPENSLPG
jgi:hypothetical protein